MAITIITISSKGQVVIPKEIKDELHWETGHELTIETTESGLLLISSAKEKTRLENLRGFLNMTARLSHLNRFVNLLNIPTIGKNLRSLDDDPLRYQHVGTASC